MQRLNRGPVGGEPGGEISRRPLTAGIPIMFDQVGAIAPDRAGEGGVAGERRVALPALASIASPRIENASTIASSSHWQGGRGQAAAFQLLAKMCPSSWPNW